VLQVGAEKKQRNKRRKNWKKPPGLADVTTSTSESKMDQTDAALPPRKRQHTEKPAAPSQEVAQGASQQAAISGEDDFKFFGVRAQPYNGAGEIRKYVRCLASSLVANDLMLSISSTKDLGSAYWKYADDGKQQPNKRKRSPEFLGDTEMALRFARQFLIPAAIRAWLPDVNLQEFCDCMQGPILHMPRDQVFGRGSWMPPGFPLGQAPWVGQHVRDVGKNLAQAILKHYGVPFADPQQMRQVADNTVYTDQRLLAEALLQAYSQQSRAGHGSDPRRLMVVLVGNWRHRQQWVWLDAHATLHDQAVLKQRKVNRLYYYHTAS
jgi:hypothetical protein